MVEDKIMLWFNQTANRIYLYRFGAAGHTLQMFSHFVILATFMTYNWFSFQSGSFIRIEAKLNCDRIAVLKSAYAPLYLFWHSKPLYGLRELILVLFVQLFDLRLSGFVCFLFLLVSGKGCRLWLWHSLDFSLTFFKHIFVFKQKVPPFSS